jgi:hypothetical protein
MQENNHHKRRDQLRIDVDGTGRLKIADFLLDEHSLSISAA